MAGEEIISKLKHTVHLKKEARIQYKIQGDEKMEEQIRDTKELKNKFNQNPCQKNGRAENKRNKTQHWQIYWLRISQTGENYRSIDII